MLFASVHLKYNSSLPATQTNGVLSSPLVIIVVHDGWHNEVLADVIQLALVLLTRKDDDLQQCAQVLLV